MTDKDIIKALECLSGFALKCRECPYSSRYKFPLCQQQVAKDALDLINRQQAQLADERAKIEICAETISRQDAEIERLKKLKCFEIFIDERIQKSNELGLRREFRTKDDYDEAFKKEIEKLYDISTATVEAIKEFAERLKKAFIKCDPMFNRHIDKLVKEMVGED